MRVNWQAADVLKAVKGQSLHVQDWIAHGVSIDSRTTQADDIYIAIKGETFDGHDFVAKAFASGASAAIVSHQPPQVPPDAPLIFVEDTFKSLQDLGAESRHRTKAKFLVVTGSVGKTSSKEMLRLMLGSLKDTYATEGNFNNHLGVPLSLARMPEETFYGVFEAGMNHAGELGPLSKEIHPDVALITNIEAVHLEHFASTESIADAKAEIFEGLDEAGTVILNKDNPHYSRLATAARLHGAKRIWGFGFDNKSEAHILNMTPDAYGTRVEASILGEHISYRLGAPGEHLAFNALGALLACAAVDADLEICAEALSAYRPPMGRGVRQLIKTEQDQIITLLDESYNASPVATKAAIHVLGQMETKGRKIAVLGDMKELGPTSITLHTDLAENLIKNKIDLVHCSGEMMAHLFASLPSSMRGHRTSESQDLATLIAQDIKDGDTYMIKGSHSMHMEKVVQALQALGQSTSTQKIAS